MHTVILAVHIVLGTLGLLLGPAVLVTGGRLRRAAAYGYQLTIAGVAVTATVLALGAFSRLWWLLPIAAATEGAALLGLRAWRRRGPGWPTATAHLLGGSYVALVTGVLIASTGNPVFWILPAIVAQWPIAVAKRSLAERQPDERQLDEHRRPGGTGDRAAQATERRDHLRTPR